MKLAIIGFGEVGQIFAAQFRAHGVTDIALYDVLFADSESGPSKAAGVYRKSASAGEAVRGGDVIVSAVTAGAALEAAQSVTDGIEKDAYFWDLNSVSPSTKRAAAKVIEETGGRYVEAAVMSSVPPKGIGSPMLLGGHYAADFFETMKPFELDLTIYSTEIGTASAVKMCRSVLIKGLEALLTESMLTAKFYGVEGPVLDSLKDTLPHSDWRKQAAYMISRALLHGKRRAEEMREVAKTVSEAGVAPMLSAPTAERQDWAAKEGAKIARDVLKNPELEALLAALRGP